MIERRATSPFDHPDARRRFRSITNVDELRQALEYPWDKWTVFLHPDQREMVERDYTGPARVSGSAGTGKTIVALHRAAHLARTYPDSRVLLTTFSDTLANALQTNLRRLLGGEPRLMERIDVYSLNAIGLLKRPDGLDLENVDSNPFGLLCFLRQTIRYETERAAEERLSFHCYIVGANGRAALSPQKQARLLRSLADTTRIRDPIKTEIEKLLLECEYEIANDLRRPSESDVSARVRHIAWPVAALIIV